MSIFWQPGVCWREVYPRVGRTSGMYHRSLAELIYLTRQRCTEELYQVHIYLLLQVLTILRPIREAWLYYCVLMTEFIGGLPSITVHITSVYVTQMIVSDYFAF